MRCLKLYRGYTSTKIIKYTWWGGRPSWRDWDRCWLVDVVGGGTGSEAAWDHRGISCRELELQLLPDEESGSGILPRFPCIFVVYKKYIYINSKIHQILNAAKFFYNRLIYMYIINLEEQSRNLYKILNSQEICIKN